MRPAILLLVFAAAAPARAGQPPPDAAALTVRQAVERALAFYPSIQISDEQIAEAAAALRLARTAYLPRVDAGAQFNRATRNNVMGLLLPQSVFPSISGPVLGTNTTDTAWGSAVGALASWEPFDFGLRGARVAVAGAQRSRAEAARARTRFETAADAADAFLTVAAAQATVVAARAGVDRADVLVRMVRALVDAQLRPGAEASRADAELAAARTGLIQAEQAAAIARTTLARFTGIAPASIAVDAPRLADMPPARSTSFDATLNPAAVEQGAVVEQAVAELRAAERTYFPRVLLQAAAYARGTGAEPTGALPGGANGLGPDVRNYAVGLSVTFPVLDLPAVRAREAQQAAALHAEEARARQIAIDLHSAWDAAVASLEGARAVAANMPTEVAAARAATEQATARYRAGLGTLVDVADAQRLFTQSEIDDALARLGVWRALLRVAIAAGDLQPFLVEVGP